MKTQHNTLDHKAQGADVMITWAGEGLNKPSLCSETHRNTQARDHSSDDALEDSLCRPPRELQWSQTAGGRETGGHVLVTYCVCILRCVPTTRYPKAGFRAGGWEGLKLGWRINGHPKAANPHPPLCWRPKSWQWWRSKRWQCFIDPLRLPQPTHTHTHTPSLLFPLLQGGAYLLWNACVTDGVAYQAQLYF